MSTTDEFVGLAILLVSLFCLGTWPAILRLCSDQSSTTHNAERRSLEFVYMDYASAYGLISCVPFVLTSIVSWTKHTTPTYDEQSLSLILIAMLGGSLLSLGNLSFQWSTAIFGTTLTTTLAIQASMTVVLGTFLNYALEPAKTNQPSLLVLGAVVFLLAIALATRAQISYAMTVSAENGHDHDQLSNHSPFGDGEVRYTVIELPYGSSACGEGGESATEVHAAAKQDDQTPINASVKQERFLGAVSNSFDESSYMAKQRQRTRHGILVAILGGFAFGFFSPCFNIAVNDPFRWRGTGPHSKDIVARTNAWFSLAFWLASIFGNVFLVRNQKRPNHGQSNNALDILWDYFTKDSWSERKLAFLAGVVCALGNVLQFQGGKMVGFATADLVQAFPLVSTVWDVVLFGEFTHVRCWSWIGGLLAAMYAAYMTGIILLACSSIA